jgi:putative lipoic acid-binding regulatory protein
MGNQEVAAEEKSEAEARARALALLEATHQFPCEYAVTVIAFNSDSVTSAVKRAAGVQDGDQDGQDDNKDGAGAVLDGAREARYESRTSSAGKYLSHRFALWLNHSGEVLDLYARLRTVEGVVTVF